MIWICLLVLTSSVCGFVMVSPIRYQTQEYKAITIRWDSQTRTDLSLTNLICVSRLNSLKVLYQMVRGLDDPESAHKQFSRRVLLDKDALKEGRLRLYVFLVTAEDSGDYWCHLYANYDKRSRKWGVQANVHFVLNVTQNLSEDISANEGATWLQEGPTQRAILVMVVLLTALLGATLPVRCLSACRGPRRDILHKWRRDSQHGFANKNKHKEALA